jgi:DNA-binding transcriptional ArsR family regulator
MKPEHTRLHEALAALAPPKRFALLLLLASGIERSVSQLASAVKLSQSCTTRHLQALERAGLVKGVRDGKRVVFRLLPRDAQAASVLASLPGGVDGAFGPPVAAAPTRAISAGSARPASRVTPPPGAAGAIRSPARRRSPPPRQPAGSERPARAAGPPDPHAVPESAQSPVESGNTSPSMSPAASPRPWPRQELEDFLL